MKTADMNFSQRMEVQGISRTPHIDLFFCFEEGFQWTFQGMKTQLGMLAGESFLVKSRKKFGVNPKEYFIERGRNWHVFKWHFGSEYS
ncbi:MULTISPECIES: hypothetical protein [Pelosinus]|uniref:hypothetical protein n=1 Tax=Pelosinus TaxID=365348 RepID=UPI0003727E6E|nr:MULTISPECIES: hypothetical protein [Pelosinus]